MNSLQNEDTKHGKEHAADKRMKTATYLIIEYLLVVDVLLVTVDLVKVIPLFRDLLKVSERKQLSQLLGWFDGLCQTTSPFVCQIVGFKTAPARGKSEEIVCLLTKIFRS